VDKKIENVENKWEAFDNCWNRMRAVCNEWHISLWRAALCTDQSRSVNTGVQELTLQF